MIIIIWKLGSTLLHSNSKSTCYSFLSVSVSLTVSAFSVSLSLCLCLCLCLSLSSFILSFSLSLSYVSPPLTLLFPSLFLLFPSLFLLFLPRMDLVVLLSMFPFYTKSTSVLMSFLLNLALTSLSKTETITRHFLQH